MSQNLFARRRQTKRKQKHKRHHADFLDAVSDEGVRTLEVVSLSHDGRGVAKFNGKTQFVEGALEGEQVRAICTSNHNTYDELDTIEVVRAVTERELPFCRHFGLCGGCRLQYMTPESQLLHKASVLKEQLNHFGALEVKHWLEPVQSPARAYRSKARLGVYFDSSRQQNVIGFRERQSKSLVQIHVCPVMQPEIERLVPLLSGLLAGLHSPDMVSHIELAAGDEQQVLVLRHTKKLTLDDKHYLQSFAAEQKVVLYLQGDTDELARPLDESHRGLFYRIKLNQTELKMYFHPQDFTQVNTQVNQVLIASALAHLQLAKHERVLDLFCGLGNFSLPMALHAQEVVGVEGSQGMVERAQRNAERNGIENASFYRANLFADFRSTEWASKSFDKILIDPPRAGALAVVNNIHHFNAQRIVYISCNPATLARDAGILAKHGYYLEKAGVVDMFPNTAHLESIAVFTRQAS